MGYNDANKFNKNITFLYLEQGYNDANKLNKNIIFISRTGIY